LASIKDVARQAGVAISTVSKVLNGYEGVSESTKDKVNAAIEALNYTPNAVAAALSSKQFGRVALLLQLAAWMRSTCSIFPARSTGQRN
jgi:LacI family transcriptional regulator